MTVESFNFKFAHAAILVSDIERSKAWYARAVGWVHEFTMDFDESLGQANKYGTKGRISMGKFGGVPLEFVQMEVSLERKELSPHYGIFMCSVHTSDLDGVLAYLEKEGIPVTRKMNVGRGALIVLTDPDGQEIGILGPPLKL